LNDQLVAGPTSRVADDESRGDPLAAKTSVGLPVEDELDADGGRDRCAQTADKGRLWQKGWTMSDRVEQVGAVDEDAIDSLERSPRVGH
jgi:hypothetical protein